ncbi:MAG: DUF6502 family protein [Gammaproteobacteria bacterium]|nr:DUF6502 family protein [Gammaproteobacteria bacterium]
MDESPKRGLLAAYSRLLGPLIRILIRNGVTFEEFAEVAKHSFVKVALEDFEAEGQEDSDNRVAALTGLSRVEIRKVFDVLNAPPEQDQNTLDGIVAILAGWHTDSDFTGPYGVPLELKFEEKDKPDFAELSGRFFPEIEPRKLLDNLLLLEIVTETEAGWFKVLKRSYTPDLDAPDGLEHMARTFQDIVNTLDHNRLEEDVSKRLYEQQVYTESGIREEDLPRFQEFSKKRAQILLEEIDNWLTQLEKPDEESKKQLSTGLGIFNYVHREK